ncbi:MAG TPA: energy transducer TonB [Candidatus Sulfotelmatobacter sp.]|jgi:TonB family protein|nr:energy transducer TonB [Candidatus Sulfotelmatobacter sp.]
MNPFIRRKLIFFSTVLPLILIVASGRLAAQDRVESTRKIVAQVAPQYPNLARSMKIQGTVKAEVVVAPNGTVKAVEIRGGHPLLVQSAQIALREWKWEPAPRETHENVEVKFGL